MIVIADCAFDAPELSDNPDPKGCAEENLMWAAGALDRILRVKSLPTAIYEAFPGIRPGTSAMMTLAPTVAKHYGLDHHDVLDEWGRSYAFAHVLQIMSKEDTDA